MNWFFFHTQRVNSRNRLRPLPSQVNSDGIDISESLNCQTTAGGMKLREKYPIGTVFCSGVCTLSARAGEPFYFVGDIYPILDGNSNYDFSLPTPTREMLDSYQEYKQSLSPRKCSSCINHALQHGTASCRFGLNPVNCGRHESEDEI